MQNKINALRTFQAKKEDHYPLLHFKAVDDIHQVRGAILIYYVPLLSLLDYQQLVLANNEYKQENKISEAPQADAVEEKKESKRR